MWKALSYWRANLRQKSLKLHVRQKLRRFPNPRSLLEGKSQPDQYRLRPSPPKKRDPHRQPRDESGRDGDIRIPGNSRRTGAASAEIVTVHLIDDPRWPSSWCNQRLQIVFVHGGVDAFLACELMIFR